MSASFKKWLKRFLIAVGGILIALVLFIYFILPESLTDYVNKNGSDRVGREITVENIDIDWHWQTLSISISQLRIGNVEGADEPYMVDIESIAFDIKLWKLLYGKFDLPQLEIVKPELVLERTDEQTANWQFNPVSKENIVTDMAVPESRYTIPDIGQLNVSDGRVIYRDAVRGLNLDMTLDTVTGTGGDDKGQVDIENAAEIESAPPSHKLQVAGSGTLQDRPFKISAEGGSVDTLRGSLKDFPLILDITMGSTAVHVSGVFDDPVKMQGIDAKLEISGNNLADLFYLTAIPLPPTPAYQITGQLSRDGETWSYNNFSGKVGSSDLSGNLSYDTSGERGYIKADLHSNVFDVKDLGGFIGITPASPVPSDRFLPDVPLNLERLRSADMDVTLKVDTLVAPNIPLNSLDITLDLEDGLLKLDPMRLTLADGYTSGQLTLDGRNQIPSVSTDIDISRLDIKKFFTDTRFEELSGGRIGGVLQLSGQGLSLSEVMAGSNGRLIMGMNGGTLSRLLIEASDIDVAEAMPLFLGDDDVTEIRCALADFNITNGLVKSEQFLIDTTDSNVKGNITIDFLTEGIDAEIQADSKTPSLLALQAPIRITGPLKSPNVSINFVKGGLRGAAAVVLGTVLTPAAGLLPFVEAGLGKDSSCYRLLSGQ